MVGVEPQQRCPLHAYFILSDLLLALGNTPNTELLHHSSLSIALNRICPYPIRISFCISIQAKAAFQFKLLERGTHWQSACRNCHASTTGLHFGEC